MAGQAPAIRQVSIKSLWKPETIESFDFTANAQLSLSANQGQLPRDRFLAGLILSWRGRITNAGSNNPTSQTVGGIFNLFDRVRVYGKHKVRRNDDTIIDLSGVNLAQLELLYTRVAPVNPTALVNTASATMDIEAQLFVPFVPMAVHPAEQKNHLLDAPNYETLYCKINAGNYSSVFSGHTTDGTFSAYGGSTGNPSITVLGLFATEPSTKFRNFIPGFLSRYSVDSISGAMTTTNNRTRLLNMPKGNKLRGVVIKTGTLKTGMTGSLRAYASLSDSLVANVQVMRGNNRSIWDVTRFGIGRSLFKINKGVAPETGYLPIDWVNSGGFGELFDTTNMVAGATGEVDFYLQGDVTGASNQQLEAIVEEQVLGYQLVG